jgi:serine protease AprX
MTAKQGGLQGRSPANRATTHRSRARTWRRPLLQAVVVGLVLICAAAAGAGASWGANVPRGASWDGATPTKVVRSSSVIVRAQPGAAARVAKVVKRLGGRIELKLPIINGFSARIPSVARTRVRRLAGVLSVTLDSRAKALSASYGAITDMGSMNNVASIIGAREYWKAGYTGKGVDVALIDSGVAPVDGLTTPGKVVDGPDLSFESQAPNLTYLDSFGHGTHMAGIIAGRANAAAGDYARDESNFLGIAPDARIVSIKVADAHGATDVSQVIAAIDWVVQHRTDNGLNIRVLNLSYGTDSSQDYRVDPLAYAAEQAWKRGIFVVAATGNAGFVKKTGTMTNPAFDPLLMAVGAADPSGTVDSADDMVPAFSSWGSKDRRPDLVAPGSHVVSLRVPGSFIDQTHSSTGAVSDNLFRGSGTSQAAAVVAGAAALVVQQRPTISVGQLKKLLTSTATHLDKTKKEAQGSGEVNLAAALNAATPSESGLPKLGVGSGSLELSRGSLHLNRDGVTLSGEKDIFGVPFLAPAIALLEASGSSWSGDTWNGSSWSGSSWSGSSWSASSWSGSSWSGSSWSSLEWAANAWSGSSWSGSSWSGSSWSGSSWSTDGWADGNWADASWD